MKAPPTVLLALAALSACADSGTAPRVPRTTSCELRSVPLAVGNRWSYDLTYDISWTDADGADVQPPEHFHGAAVREIIGLETLDGREYAVEQFTAVSDDGPLTTEWRRYRQDEGALYQADVTASVPPGEVPDGEPLADQIRLRFPVTPGDSWRLRPDSDFAILTVVARDTLELAVGATPAWRVRLDVATARPNDYIFLWYGARGFVRREAHSELNAVNPGTNEVVTIVTDEVDELVELDLVGGPQ